MAKRNRAKRRHPPARAVAEACPEGWVDVLGPTRIAGWVWDAAHPPAAPLGDDRGRRPLGGFYSGGDLQTRPGKGRQG